MMIRKFYLSAICIFLTASAFAIKNGDFESKVRDAVNYQMKMYPESTLKDLYKNFFQDRFGPGHIINDTAAAKRYLLSELDSYTTPSGEMAEAIGWEHNFYRVNLAAIKNGTISPGRLLDAFARSANEIVPTPIEEWRKEWSQIETIIQSMNLSLPNYEADSDDIKKRLEAGNYVGHHSEAFNKAYAPHYRIVNKKIFEEELLPLIKSKE